MCTSIVLVVSTMSSAHFVNLNLTHNILYNHFQQGNQSACPCFRMNNYGMGSDLHTFGQALWNMKAADKTCFVVEKTWIWDRRGQLFHWPWTAHCAVAFDWKSQKSIQSMPKREARAIALAFTLSFLRPSVFDAARKTAHALGFSTHYIKDPLVTIHIRWGDKHKEMKLLAIDEYINAVRALKLTRPAIFVTTEDVNAIKAFKARAMKNWAVYTYSNATSTLTSGKDGRPTNLGAQDATAGFHSLVSFWVGFQSSYFVVTRGSNWSRLFSELCLIDHVKQCVVKDLSPRSGYDHW